MRLTTRWLVRCPDRHVEPIRDINIHMQIFAVVDLLCDADFETSLSNSSKLMFLQE